MLVLNHAVQCKKHLSAELFKKILTRWGEYLAASCLGAWCDYNYAARKIFSVTLQAFTSFNPNLKCALTYSYLWYERWQQNGETSPQTPPHHYAVPPRSWKRDRWCAEPKLSGSALQGPAMAVSLLQHERLVSHPRSSPSRQKIFHKYLLAVNGSDPSGRTI